MGLVGKKQTLYQIDAFTDKIFSGNPAAVVPLDNWISEKYMQSIAMENNLSETAFIVKENKNYSIRWYTCLLYTSPSPRDGLLSRMPSSA